MEARFEARRKPMMTRLLQSSRAISHDRLFTASLTHREDDGIYLLGWSQTRGADGAY